MNRRRLFSALVFAAVAIAPALLIARPSLLLVPSIPDKTYKLNESFSFPISWSVGDEYCFELGDYEVTFSKQSGPSWVNVSAGGTVSGTTPGSAGTANVVIRVDAIGFHPPTGCTNPWWITRDFDITWC